jgi:hypothetical protein
MIARIPQVVSRTITSALVATTLAFGAVTLAAPYPTQLDPATTYGWIRLDPTGSVVNAYDTGTNSTIISVPASNFFGSFTPSVKADGSVVDQNINLNVVNAPEGMEFTLENVKLVRNDAGNTLQLEVGVKGNQALFGTYGVQFQLENKTSGGVVNFGANIDIQ